MKSINNWCKGAYDHDLFVITNKCRKLMCKDRRYTKVIPLMCVYIGTPDNEIGRAVLLKHFKAMLCEYIRNPVYK